MRYEIHSGPSYIATPVAVVVILGNLAALITSYLPEIEAVLRVLALLLSVVISLVVLAGKLRSRGSSARHPRR